jgi:hypothetical protein
VSKFVKECRREWKRLRVPDPIANEMAADLEADLAEAEAEGASAEQVLGSGAFDPKAFAASWAAERGVARPLPEPVTVPLPLPRGGYHLPRRARVPVLIAVAAILLLALTAVASHRSSSAVAIAAPVMRQPPFPGIRGFVVHSNVGPGVFLPAIGLLVLLAAILVLIVAILYWSPWPGLGRSSRRRSMDENLG